MSKLKDLFKRKPGGTTLGNLLRSGAKMAANTLAPGSGKMVGNGAMRISEGAYNDKTLRKSELETQLRGAIEGPLAAATVVSKDDPNLQYTTNGAQAQKNALVAYATENKKPLLIAVAVIAGIVIIIKKMGGRKRR